ncbi:metal ABC transporter solute-binding protein, Zn/Mn family [Thiovibrio sp. JS02]
MHPLNQPGSGRRTARILLLLPFLLSAACGILHLSAPACHARLDVFVSLPPQGAIVSRIGGPHVRSHVMVKAGQDPHTFEPKPRQVQELAGASLYFTSGLPFETQIGAKLRDRKNLVIVDTTAGIAKVTIEDDHHHGHEEETDPHVWLSPGALAIMAENIGKALCDKDPGNQAVYRENLASLLAEIARCDSRIRKLLAPHAGRTFYVFHPAFGYFAREYGLRQKAVEVGGKSPSPKQLAALIHQAKSEEVKIIFVQPQFETRNAQVIAKAIDGAVVAIDPLSEDILDNLLVMADEIAKALQ